MSNNNDPFAQPPQDNKGFQQGPPNMPPNQYGGQAYGQTETLPNAQAVLIMGILSLVLVGLIGLILAILTLNQSKEGMELIRQYPGRYNGESNIKIGRVLAYISLGIFGLIILILIIMFGIVGMR